MAGRDQSQDHSRAAARRKRQPAPPVKTDSSGPIFGTPVKCDNKDDLSRTVQSMLGRYDNFKVKPHELGLSLGVGYQPQTPVPGEGKNISHFPVINGQTKTVGHPSGAGSSSSKGSSQGKKSLAEGLPTSHHHANSKSGSASASSSSKGVKRESGTASQLTSSTAASSSSSSHSKTARSSNSDKAKESQRRSKDGSAGARTTTKPPSASSADSGNSQAKAPTNQSSKSDSTPTCTSSSSSSTSKSGSSHPSTNSASRGSSNSSSNSNASDSKTVLHPNGLLTETCHYPLKPSGAKSDQMESKQASSHSKKDLSSARDLPFISPMPDIIADFQSRSAPKPTSRDSKKDRDSEAKQRPRLDIPKKGA